MFILESKRKNSHRFNKLINVWDFKCLTSQKHLKYILFAGKESVGYSEDEDVYAVLEEDGTEVDEEEYFQLLPPRTRLIVLSCKEIWSPMDSMQG